MDSSAFKRGLYLFRILPNEIDLRIGTCKSNLWTEAERRKLPVSREAAAVDDGIDNRAFSNFLLELSIKISTFRHLNAVAVPGRRLFLPNLFSLQCDYVQFDQKSMKLSPEQASVLPAPHFFKPGTIIDSNTLKEMLHAVLKEGFLDINE